jgi:hypothetical protein
MFGGFAFGQPYCGRISGVTAVLAASAQIAIGVTPPNLASRSSFAASPAIAFSTQGALRAPVGLRATSGFALSTSGDLLAPSRYDRTAVRIMLGGVDVTTKVKTGTLTIHDAINHEVNTARLTFRGSPPQTPQPLEVYLNKFAPRLLFNGTLAHVDHLYYQKDRTQNLSWPADAVDDLARAGKRLPFGTWTNVSATTVAQQLVATFAAGFTTTHVQAGLPLISVTFNGTEGMGGALQQIAKLIGGYYYWENKDLHLFTEETGELPDPIDATHPFLNDPPITKSVDVTQIRTRVYGKGHGETVATDVAANETILPLADTTMFNVSGGKAITDSQRLAYTGLHTGDGGGLVGPGAAPSVAPVAALASGSGIENGVHGYAVTFVTASGESKASPVTNVTTGAIAPPPTAPVVGVPTAGGSIGAGDYTYSTTFVTPSGETTLGSNSSSVHIDAPVAEPSANPNWFIASMVAGNVDAGDHFYAITFFTSSGETLQGPTLMYGGNSGGASQFDLGNLPVPSDGRVIGRRLYRTKANQPILISSGPPPTPTPTNAQFFLLATLDTTSTTYHDNNADASLGSAHPPTVNNTGKNTVPLSSIPLGPAGTTGRNIYRYSSANPTFKLALALTNNTATTASDTLAQASLGAAAPSVNTATMNRVALASIQVGGGGTTARKIYRTAAGASPLKLLTTISDNTTATYTDSAADATLGADAPIIDTSGLAQPPGQVNPGETSLILANAAAFAVGGGWAVIGNGQQVIRYTGRTATALTGIPAAGIGAITAAIGYNSTITPAPALTGVSGLTLPLIKGVSVNIWVQRDDTAAQGELAALAGDGSDGIVEHLITDERRGEASLIALCDADLALYSRPIVTVRYATRDVKTKSGRPIVIDLAVPAIHETLTIQAVDIDQIDIAVGMNPRYTVTASTVRFSLEDILRRLTGGLEGL